MDNYMQSQKPCLDGRALTTPCHPLSKLHVVVGVYGAASLWLVGVQPKDRHPRSIYCLPRACFREAAVNHGLVLGSSEHAPACLYLLTYIDLHWLKILDITLKIDILMGVWKDGMG